MRLLFTTVVLLVSSANLACAETSRGSAEAFLAGGRYDEAFEAFASEAASARQVIGQARCLVATGKADQAIARLQRFSQDDDDVLPSVHALLAQLHFSKGDYASSSSHVDDALALDKDGPHALFVAAELERVKGRIESAKKRYEAITGLPQDRMSVEDLFWVGQAMTQLGRWNRNARVFDQLVNEFYPALLKRDPTFWPAHLESGKLFLEKFNDADAARELNAALAINPRAAEVHVELGRLALQNLDLDTAISSVERALRINPQLLTALQLTADIAFTNLQPDKAAIPLRQAEEVNAADESTLGRKLTVFLRQDGFDSTENEASRASKLIREAVARNPHCGHFFAAAGESFDALRLYPMAHRYYLQAIERLPQLVSARGKLGLVQMRLGREKEARQTLEESFAADPFNVRVKNSLEVLDLLDTYAVIETDHFVIRFDRGQDGLLAEYAARYLEEEVYPDICQSLDYHPADKTLLEIFSQARGTSGHSWFSARMVGLPFIGTVGACAGKMFALTSPADGKSYNWARVLRHEFVHVVNLQQTSFMIPHWFTEALAMRHEMGSYPPEWDQILTKYVAEDKLFNLANINHGFVRPGTSERWTLAYFQAYLYAKFIEQLGGQEALRTMLQRYAEGHSTTAAIQFTLELTSDEFERQYRDFLKSRMISSRDSELDPPEELIESLQERLASNAKDPKILARLSAAYATRGRRRDAREFAERALALDASQPLASYVMAQLMFSIGEDEKAWQYIEAGLDQAHPDPKLLAFAAQLKFDLKQFDAAANYYRLGQQKFPFDFRWTRGLARVHLANNDVVALVDVLTEIANRDMDKTPYARKLTQLMLQKKDYAAAEFWANRVLHVDVLNPLAHAELAAALEGQGKWKDAIREYRTALQLSPGESSWQQRLDGLLEQKAKP